MQIYFCFLLFYCKYLWPSNFRPENEVFVENILLRQQLSVYKRKHTRPRFCKFDRVFWIFVKNHWRTWKNALLIVKPETVVSWHRRGFRLYWDFISKRGRKTTNTERRKAIRRLIKQMAKDNPIWGSPRIHGELLKLGFRVSERTVSRHMPKRKYSGDNHGKWLTFLHNHRHALAAMDLFTVPTLFFRQLYCFFIIGHDKRKIIHFNVTFHPTAEWIKTQLEKAFSSGYSFKYLIHDRSSVFSALVDRELRSMDIESVKTSYQSPWQNGLAERFIGSARRDILDHVIILNKRHLYKLFEEYLDYYHDDRTHYGLDKETPRSRPVQAKPTDTAKIIDLPRLGGLHHRYFWEDAA